MLSASLFTGIPSVSERLGISSGVSFVSSFHMIFSYLENVKAVRNRSALRLKYCFMSGIRLNKKSGG